MRRIYGDFTSPSSAAWKKVLQRNAIKPIQQFAYSTGKNATDSTLIIDAMDLLYTDNLTASAWSPATATSPRLATRLGKQAQWSCPVSARRLKAFRNACHRFVFVEVLRAGDRSADTDEDEGPKRRPGSPPAGGDRTCACRSS